MLAWVPAALVVPLAMAGAVRLAAPPDPDPAITRLHPIAVGTTWVYAVSDHGKPSGHRTVQIASTSKIGDDVLDSVAMTSHYTDYPGLGDTSNTIYLGATRTALMQYGLYSRHEYQPIEPPAPAYELPVEPGASWSYEGKVGSVGLTYEVHLRDVVDVAVGGRTFTGCAHYVTTMRYSYDQEPGEPETLEEWTCPGYGPVRTRDTVAASDVDITEDLVAFHGRDLSWSALEAKPVSAVAHPGDTAGFDAARSHALPDGAIDHDLAWSDSPSVDVTFGPVSDGDVAVLAENDGEVSGRDTGTGEIRWRVRLTGPIVVAPAIAGGTVLVADADKRMWALDLEDGSTRWVHRFDDMVAATPAVADDRAVVAVEDGTVTALDLADGSTLWATRLPAAVRSAPASSEGQVVVATPDGEVAALDLETGHQAWTRTLEGSLAAGPSVADGVVLAADSAGVLYAYDTTDGRLRWEARSHAYPDGDLAAGNGTLLVRGEDRLEAYALDDGALHWSVTAPAAGVSPVIVGAHALDAAAAGEVTVRDLATGRSEDTWRLPLPAPGSSIRVDVPIGFVDGDVVLGGRVDAEAHQSTFFAYPVTAAARRPGVSFDTSLRRLPSNVGAPPVASGETIFVPGQDKVLYRSTDETHAGKVLASKGLQPGVVVTGDVVIAQRDDVVQAEPVAGGDPLWTFPAGEPFIGSIPSVADGTVFVPEYGLGLAALRLDDGSPLWFTPITNPIGTMPPLPVPGGDVVYGSGSLARYDGVTGAQQWSLPDSQLFSTASYADGLVYADAVRDQHPGGLVAVDARSGRIVWSHPNDKTQIVVGPVVGDGVVVYPDSQGLVTAFDAADGTELWHVRLATPIAGAPVISGGRVYLGETGREEDFEQRDFRVSAHDVHTGAFLGAFQPPGQGYQKTPAMAGTADGRLLVPATGRFGAVLMVLEPQP